jgi:hypothetical protein
MSGVIKPSIRKEVIMMATRGRPRSRNPKSNLNGIRLSKDDLAHVNELAGRMRLLPDEIVRLLLRSANVEDLKERIGR